MTYPESVERLATEVAKSWKSRKSNYIIVASPLSEPHYFFQLLADKEFQRRVLDKDADRLAVARVGESDFRNYDRLATTVVRQWNLAGDITIDPEFPLGALELALQTLNERNRIPIVLVDRFHDALKWLDGDFGVTLRELENNHFLKTVVEIPVKLADLRLRWEVEPEGSPFLQSDWGQAHSEKVLKGYSESEITALLTDKADREEFAKLLFKATAGLPGLVERFVDRIGAMNLSSFEHFLRVEAPRSCDRLVKWLDCPKEDIYKRLAAESLQCPNVRIRGVALTDHSWADLLLRKDGSFTCLMLGWASLETLSREHNRAYIEMITEHARRRRFSQVTGLLPSTLKANEADGEIWKALGIVNRFCGSTDVYQSEWADSSKCLSDITQLASRSTNPHICKAAKDLSHWGPLTDLMCAYSSKKASGKDLRLEDFVCQQKSEEAFTAFLQLHRLRLKMADSLDPLPAMKSVIEQPESLMQVYAFYKFEIQFWNFQGLEDEIREKVEKVFRRPFTSPPKGQRLGFQDLLWLSHAMGEYANPDERFFDCPDDVVALEAQYRARCEQVHSASFASSGDWNAYQRSCLALMEMVERAVLGDHRVEPLPDPVECFCELVKTLGEIPRPS